MRSPRLACLLVLFSISACDQKETQVGPYSPNISAQFTNRIAELDLPGVNAHFLRRGPEDVAVMLELSPNLLQPILAAEPQQGISALDAMERYQPLVLLGSGFATHAQSLEPVGVLKIAGLEYSPLQPHGYTRVVVFNDKDLAVIHRNEVISDNHENAIQLGPGIVERGQLDISERDLQRPRYFRSFLVLCSERWLVGVTTTPMHLRTLGQALQDYFAGQSWRCNEAINLAGDRQSVLVVRIGEEIIHHGDIESEKVSFLGFKPG